MYDSVKDLPEKAQQLTRPGQDLWRRVYNETFKRLNHEARAARAAWLATERAGYRRRTKAPGTVTFSTYPATLDKRA